MNADSDVKGRAVRFVLDFISERGRRPTGREVSEAIGVCVEMARRWVNEAIESGAVPRHPDSKPTLGERRAAFLARTVPDGECVRWLAARDWYGHACFYGKTDKAHRVAYRLFVGDIPDGLEVMHSCDHKWCVNPHHLSVGTHLENVRQAKERGLIASSDNHYMKRAEWRANMSRVMWTVELVRTDSGCIAGRRPRAQNDGDVIPAVAP